MTLKEILQFRTNSGRHSRIVGTVVVVIVWYLDLQLPMQSVSVINNAVISNPIQERCKLDTILCDKVCILQCFPVSSINKTDRHDITEILLKVALNTIKSNQNNSFVRSNPAQDKVYSKILWRLWFSRYWVSLPQCHWPSWYNRNIVEMALKLYIKIVIHELNHLVCINSC